MAEDSDWIDSALLRALVPEDPVRTGDVQFVNNGGTGVLFGLASRSRKPVNEQMKLDDRAESFMQALDSQYGKVMPEEDQTAAADEFCSEYVFQDASLAGPHMEASGSMSSPQSSRYSADHTRPGKRRVVDIEEEDSDARKSKPKLGKIQLRRQRKREQMRRLRLRKKFYVESLVRTVEKLRNENENYSRLISRASKPLDRIKELEMNREKLLLQNQALRNMLGPTEDEGMRNARVAFRFLQNLTKAAPKGYTLRDCDSNASFLSDSMPYVETIDDYVDIILTCTHKWFSGYQYVTVSSALEGNKVVLVTFCSAVYDGHDGPVPPTKPPKIMRIMVIHHFSFTNEGKIMHCDKIFDTYTLAQQLQWPIDDEGLVETAKVEKQFSPLQGPALAPDVSKIIDGYKQGQFTATGTREGPYREGMC